MQIDLLHFTPWASLAGGVLVGVSAAGLVLLLGRVLGVSGIAGGLLSKTSAGDRGWRVALLLGLIAAPLVWRCFAPLPAVQVDAKPVTLLIAGLLVGIGTRYGAGCTSGHGVCGLSRLSLRSLVATLAFMAAGFATVYLVRHGLGG